MNCHAYVVPVLGKALFKGDVATVASSCVGFLRQHPGYTLSIRRRDKGEADSGYAVLLFHTGEQLAYTPRLGAMDNAVQRDHLQELTDEILTTLHNQSIHPRQELSP